MPYPSEHAARVIEPSKFEKDSFRRKNIAEGIDIIIGRLKGETTLTAQAYRFNASKFTPEQAKKWLKDHDIDYILFEPAAKKGMSKNSIEFKAIKGDDLTITPSGDDFVVEGWASTYGNVDSGDDVCEKGCFTKTLSEMGSRIAFCFQHDMRNPIGKMELTDKPEGLWLKARISDAEQDIKTKVKEGILKEFSIGFQTINSSNRVIDGKEVRCLNEVKLYEVSLVTLAMNEKATLQSYKSQLGINGIDDLEELFDKAIINESNTIKKHDLMKLKLLALDMIEPQNALENEKPQDEVKEVVEYLQTNFKLLQ